MKKPLNRKLVKFYLWLSAGYFLLALLSTIGKYPGKILPLLINNFWAVLYVTALNFTLLEYIIPFLLRKKKNIVFNILYAIPILFFFMILYSYGAYEWKALGVQLHIYTVLRSYPSLDVALENHMAYSVGSIVLFGIARHSYNFIKLRQAEQQLRIEKQEAELNYLRSQTNPHFLFNTLNNIYSLARDKSDLAAESILRLSKMLRFMLYETGGDYIAIEQELKIINDYVALEKLRYDESLSVNFNYDIEDMKQALPPLLLIPLVENAFKHGVSETRERPYVDMHLSVKQRRLLLTIKNSAETSPGQTSVKENIGLSNLRRQLELLYTDYELSVRPGKSAFTAILKINLASHV